MPDDYFYNVLKLAISKFDLLVSKGLHGGSTYGKNMETRLSGDEIVKLFNEGKSFWIGRNRGLHGAELLEDKVSGKWHGYQYEINLSSDKAPSRNWFSAKEFIGFIGGQ